jgi:(S)-coclaurine N-methyltransferase
MMIKITLLHLPLARELQLQNVDIIVADISTLEMEASYDRIFSIGMFEV